MSDITELTHTDSKAAGRTAWNVAILELKRRHADELAQIVGDEREKRGLPRERPAYSESPEAIRAKMERALARVEKYRKQLGEA